MVSLAFLWGRILSLPSVSLSGSVQQVAGAFVLWLDQGRELQVWLRRFNKSASGRSPGVRWHMIWQRLSFHIVGLFGSGCQ